MPEETEDTAADTTTDVTPAVPEWRAGLPEEIRGAESLVKFDDAENPLIALANGYLGAEKAVGADKVVLPGQGATDEEKRAFWSAIGCPESVDGYTPPTDNISKHFDADLFDTMREDAHRLGVTPQQLAGLSRAMDARAVMRMEQAETKQTQQIEQWHAELHQKHGDAFDQNMELVWNTAHDFGGEEFVTLLKETGLNNHPVMVNTLVKFARAMAEDEIMGGGGAQRFANTPEQAMTELNALKLDPEHMKAWGDPNHPGHKTAVAKETALFQQIHPEPK